MKAYKGFNKDMTCRGFQFEEGKTYETDEAVLCEKGFHACERPMDVFKYYNPAHSVYHEVELEEVSDERSDDDTKIVGRRITIGRELTHRDLIAAQEAYVKAHCTNENNAEPGQPVVAGEKGSAAAGWNGSAAAGWKGSAAAGWNGSAAAGDYGSAAAGWNGSAAAGENGSAAAGENGSAAAGKNGSAVSRGQAASERNGVSVARGNGCRVRGGLGALLVIAEEACDDYDIVAWKAVIVDGKTVKADTWYKLEAGGLVEAED